jgi:hypothetical protein
MSEARISQVRIGAAHDGDAELIVTLTYENGGQSHIALDEYAARFLLTAQAASTPEDLIGTHWDKVRDALAAASDRYAEAHNATQPTQQ